ncbi:Magnesium and cobalt efflux protein CorC [Planctomycetes bacterium Pla163]|uniref:Magnesium and cobalt efflux protein CorC n=1 Tax=Rohdeia mirabilis TaxID=2528008 RepID=A0A518D1M8_9BACT|nr:Magnesium and cobalt efflux protein CorC [Planctomycetes bacterium Pla163]
MEAFIAFSICIALSALFSGAETGFYSLSVARLEVDAEQGKRMARLVRYLARSEHALLVAILIGNNLMIELVTHFGDELFGDLGLLPDTGRELVLTAILTPVVFLFAELVPKDLFRRRPHSLLGFAAPVVALARVVFLPVSWPLGVVTRVSERLMGIDDANLEELRNREHVYEMLEEGTLSGALPQDAVELARNVLEVRTMQVASVMVPWSSVATIPSDVDETELVARVGVSNHTRLPVVEPDGDVRGYVHQLDVLSHDGPGVLESNLRRMIEFPPSLPVDRALSRLRSRGQRTALVREEGAKRPLGLVTLKDLAQTIVGDFADW